MAWVALILAGLVETGWAVGLKHTDGFTRLWPSIITAVGIGLSMFLLALAARSMPTSTAYPVWVGIGAAGTVLFDAFVLQVPTSPARIAFLMLLLVAIVGLKATSP